MKKRILVSIILVLAIVGLSGCTFPLFANSPDQPSGTVAQTAAAQTVEAQLTANANQSPGQSLDTTSPGQESTNQPMDTLAPTNTLQPTNTPLPTFTSTPSVPCDKATMTTETVADGTEFASGATFTKTWTIKNIGSCTWTSGYDVFFSNGDAMGGTGSWQLTSGTVAPNQTVTISVDLTAPGSPGTYKGVWKVRNSNNEVFTQNGFWAQIKVVNALSYNLEFDNVHNCGFFIALISKVTNNGSEHIESASVAVTDLTTSNVLAAATTMDHPFFDRPSGCADNIANIEPGDYYFLGRGLNSPPVSGNKIKVVVNLCTQDGLAGDCLQKSYKFIAP